MTWEDPARNSGPHPGVAGVGWGDPGRLPVHRPGAHELVDHPVLNLVGDLSDPIGLGTVQAQSDPEGALSLPTSIADATCGPAAQSSSAIPGCRRPV